MRPKAEGLCEPPVSVISLICGDLAAAILQACTFLRALSSVERKSFFIIASLCSPVWPGEVLICFRLSLKMFYFSWAVL